MLAGMFASRGGGGGGGIDPHFANVVSLAHFNGTNGSTTITDQVLSNWTAAVNCTISTAQSRFGGASVINPGESGSYVESPISASLTLGTGDFTIEFWLYGTISGTDIVMDCRPVSTQGAYPVLYYVGTTLHYYVNSANQITGTASLSDATWMHIAVCRASGITKLFVNGTQVGSDWSDSTDYANTSFRLANGRFTTGNPIDGYIDDFRVTKFARYTANFTPPSAQFPDS